MLDRIMRFGRATENTAAIPFLRITCIDTVSFRLAWKEMMNGRKHLS